MGEEKKLMLFHWNYYLHFQLYCRASHNFIYSLFFFLFLPWLRSVIENVMREIASHKKWS